MEVLRPVPKKSLGILLTKGYNTPHGQYNTQHPSWSSSLSRERRQSTSLTDCQPLGGLRDLQA
ncbi:hypothetical protein Taro_013001 [Colocasia esculenta]|uniref:Uncharacterized protein n=1 Tax=Colocasia esculenta TaxID=4460 RepID=A0A843UEE9_COLES|nr:hypothetical protein [Colocasia esculenta]